MLKARPDRKNPQASSGDRPVRMIGSRSVDRIRAAVICAANAVHMTAPDRETITPKKALQQGSHPHMKPTFSAAFEAGEAKSIKH
jgi:hypothetical protein